MAKLTTFGFSHKFSPKAARIGVITVYYQALTSNSKVA